MKTKYPHGGPALLLVVAVFFANPLLGQSQAPPAQGPAPVSSPGNSPRPQSSAARRDDASLDTLFAADSYKMYGEVRMVGQLVRSPGVVEILEPILKLSSPPDDFKTFIKFLNTNADTLATSRMLFGAMPARSGLPQMVVAIELPSVEEAQKFEPKVQKLLPILFPTPTPTPTPTSSPTATPIPSPTPSASSSPKPAGDNQTTILAEPVLINAGKPSPQAIAVIDEKKEPDGEKKEPDGPPFIIKRSGALILISDIPFTFRKLRPAGSKLLTEDQNFRVARDRFSSEPLFVYYNLGLEDRNKSRQVEVATSDDATLRVEELSPTPKEETTVESKPEVNPEAQPATPDASPSPDSSPPTEDPEVFLSAPDSAPQLSVGVTRPVSQPAPDPTDPFLSSLFGAFGWGEPGWPEALGVALSFEGDSYIMRVILIDPPDTKTTPIPFLPQLISGRSFTPEAPSVLPADTEFFASASLDLPRMYAALLQNLQKMNTVQAGYSRSQPGEKPAPPADTAVTEAAFEKKYGFKIKEELLPALGNEVAVGGSFQSLGLGDDLGMPSPPPQPTPSPSPSGSTQSGQAPGVSAGQGSKSPVFLISVKDRDALKGLIPRLLDAMGMKELSLIAQTEKRDDTETVTYAGVVSYAFVDKFLVLSPDVAAVRHVVDSYLNHETLGSNNAFRTFTRWQPREIQAQAYVAPSVMAAYRETARNPAVHLDQAMREFLAKLNPAPEAITYALSNDSFGPLHELRLPKNLVLMSVAGISAGSKQSPLEQNETVSRYALYSIMSAEMTHRETTGNGTFCSLDQLVAEKLIQKGAFENNGYKIELIVAGTKFEATATPKEYGTTGRISFFVDETGVVKGADHNGAPANAGDQPIQ